MSAPSVRAALQQNMKTETEYNMKSIRFLLLTITAMFIIIGVMMMMLGISVYGHYHTFSFFYESTKSGRFVTPSVLCVFVGLLLLMVSSFGFLGSLKQSTLMVNMYALILLVVLVIKLVVIILAFTTSSDILMDYINIPVSQYPVDPEIQAEIDSLQYGLNCCGSESILDYVPVSFPDTNTTIPVTVEQHGDHVTVDVPHSCCAVPAGLDACARVHVTGCKFAIVDAIVQNASVLGVLGISVMFILLLGIIFALLLARCIRKLKSERALMAWRIREQLILARMEEDKKIDNHTMYITPPDSSAA